MLPVPSKPHVSKTAGGVSQITGSNETMCISNGSERLWLQEGLLLDESGNVPDPVPGWFWQEFNKLSAAMKQRHGNVLKLAKGKVKDYPSSRGDLEQDNPAPVPALKAGDDSDQGGDPSLESKEEEQLSPELLAALNISKSLDAADEENQRRADAGEISAENEDAEKEAEEAANKGSKSRKRR